MTGSVHCQIDQCREVTSTITGHKLRVNMVADKFLVVSDADFSKLPGLTVALINWLTDGGRVDHGIARNIIEALRGFADVGDASGMCIAIDRVVAELLAVETKRMGQKTAVISWLQRLWEEEYIAFPASLPFKSKIKLPCDQFGFPTNHEWITALRKASPRAGDVNRIPGLALRAAATAIGTKEVGDLIPDGVSEEFFVLNGAIVLKNSWAKSGPDEVAVQEDGRTGPAWAPLAHR